MIETAIRSDILQKLHARNKHQRDGFVELISQNNKLHDAAEDAGNKQLHFKIEAERLKQENVELQVKLESGSGGGGGGKAVQVLEQKLYKQQEELTELHRKKGENAQQLIDLNKAVQDKEKQLREKNEKVTALTEQLEELERKISMLEQNNSELLSTNQILADEQKALNLAYVSLEEKFRHIAEENSDILKRFMEYKSKAADNMNFQNDIAIKKKQQKMQQQLQEAAKEEKQVILPDDGGMRGPAMCFAVTIPSRALHSFEAHEGEVNAVKWSPSGRRCATGGSDRKVKIWEINNGRSTCACTLTGSNAAVLSVEFDLPEQLLLAATANDFSVRVWTIGDGRLRHSLTGHSGKVSCAKFLSGSSKAVSGSREMKIWDLRRGACDKTVFVSTCLDVVTSDGLATSIISGHFDRKIRFWDTRLERAANEITVQGKVTSLDLSPDGNSLLSCVRGDVLNAIDVRMNKIVRTLSDDHFKVGSDYTRAVFSPDAMYAMAGSSDGHLFIWDVNKQKLEKVLKDGHSSTVLACSWDPRGSSLLSSDKHRTVTYWADF